jgi:hypothetical protein
MKNQDFGDNRDLLKFDLVYQIIRRGLVDRFTYIPMLTENVKRSEEPQFCRHNAACGGENQELIEFFDRCIINEKRNINQLEEFFGGFGIKAVVYNKDHFFTNTDRSNYFAGIGQELLTRSLILIDPDKGLEEDVNNAGNLLYSELRDIYERMDDNSCLMFFQRFPYNLYEEYLGMRCDEIKDYIPGSQPISLDDLDSIIFFMTKNQVLQQRLLQLLGEYTQQYAKKEE